jgi:hypothetical protein
MAQKAELTPVDKSDHREAERLDLIADRHWNNIRDDPIIALTANCLDGVFKMLTVFHGASPDREMFANRRFISSRPWKRHLPPHISCVRKVRHSWPSVQWVKKAQLHWTFRW